MKRTKKNNRSKEDQANQIPFEQEKEQFMSMIGDVLSSKDFSSPEEATQFLNEAFTGRSMSDSLAEWDTRPPTPLDEAREVLNRCDPDSPPATQRRYAKKALKITPDCMEAWEALAWSYQSPVKIEQFLLKGIQHGRKLHADLIATIDGENGLWGYIETRPFMMLFESLANLYSQDGLLEKTVETYEQIMALNPGDNQGIRGQLLHGYIKLDRLEEAQQLADRFSDDIDLGIVYGRVLIELIRILDSDYDFEILVKKGNQKKLKLSDFGNTFAKAKTLMREAIGINPYLPLLIMHPASLYVEPPGAYQMGSPDQALIFIDHFGTDWLGSMIGWIFMGAFINQAKARIKKDRKNLRESYADLLDYLDQIDSPPWQEVLLGQMKQQS